MKKITFLKRIFPYIGVIAVVIIFGIATGGKILSPRNLISILDQMLVMCLISVGYMFTMTTGALDYTVSSTYALACMVLALVSTVDPWLALLAAIAVGVAMGALTGTIIAKFLVPSSIIGLSMMFALRGVVQYMVAKHGSFTVPLSMHRLNELWLRLAIFLVVFLIGGYLFVFHKFGWWLRAVGSRQLVSRYSGIPVEKTRILAFAFSGISVGCAAFIGMLRSGTAGATTGASMGLNVLLAMVMGGMSVSGGFRSNYIATIVGCAFMTILSNGLVLIEADVATQQLLKGVIFVVTVALSVERKAAPKRKKNR